MTIEEKAKAYDEALEKAKAHINSKGIGDTVDLCKDLFSELVENEDERIRKFLIKLVNDGLTSFPDSLTRSGVLAYLEKQKDILSERARNITANMLEDGIEGIQRELIEFLSNTINAPWVDIIKSADAYAQRIRSMVEKQKEQKQEWSEEDRRIMDGIQLVLESWDRTHSSIAGLPSLIPSYISWLKARRPQSKQKRQIKEGDKVSIHCRKDRKEGIITIYDGKVGEVIHVWDAKRNPWGHIGVRLDNGCNNGFYEDELEVLDEPSWKPSEEQMEALRVTIDFMPDTFKPRCTLITLQNGLEKLMSL